MMRFQNKVVLVTGGSRGIGAAISTAFAAEGAQVAINYRSDEESAHNLLKTLKGAGHMTFRADMGNAASVKTLFEEVVAGFGHVDIVVNNAAVHDHHPADTVSWDTWQDQWQKTLAVNLIGPANLTYLAANHMIDKNVPGRILFVGSRGAFRGEPGQPAYGASKGGLHSFAQSMAKALGQYSIGVAVVAPGFVETDMVADLLKSDLGKDIRAQSPFNRVARPEEVAHTVLFLADPKSIWNSGAIVDVNGASYFR